MDDGTVNISYGSRAPANGGFIFSNGGISGPGGASSKTRRRRKAARRLALHQQAVAARERSISAFTQQYESSLNSLNRTPALDQATLNTQVQSMLERQRIDLNSISGPPHLLEFLREQERIQQLSTRLRGEKEFLEHKANAYYGSSPLDKSLSDYLNRFQQFGETAQAHQQWQDAYTAALGARSLAEHLAVLNARAIAVHQLTALAHAEGLAREQQRAAMQQRGENARLEQLKFHQERQAQVKSLRGLAEVSRQAVVTAMNSMRVPAVALSGNAQIITGRGHVASDVSASALLRSIEDAVKELGRIASAGKGGPIASFVSLMSYAPQAGLGSDIVPKVRDREVQVILPPAHFATALPANLHEIADASGTVDLPYRLRAEPNDQGSMLHIAKTGDGGVLAAVPVMHARFDVEKNAYVIQSPGFPARVLELALPTLGAAPAPEIPALNARQDGLVFLQGTAQVQSLTAEASLNFNDLIAVLPAGAPVPYLYLSGVSRHQELGVALGVGEPSAGDFSSHMATRSVAGIPSEVADQVRWRQFSSQAEFHRYLWKHLAAEIPPGEALSSFNSKRMEKGLAPIVPRQEWAGNRKSLEFQYFKPNTEIGDAFNVDNMRIASPRAPLLTAQASKPFVPWVHKDSETAHAFTAVHATQAAALKLEQETEKLARAAAEQAIAEHLAREALVKTAHTFPASIALASMQPLFMTPAGVVATVEGGAQVLEDAVRHAVANVSREDAPVTTGIIFGVATPSEDAPDSTTMALSLPLSMLTSLPLEELQYQAAIHGEIEVPVRLASATESDDLAWMAIPTRADEIPKRVRVRSATFDAALGVFSARSDDVPQKHIVWTPALPPGQELLGPTEPASNPTTLTVYSGTSTVPVVPEMEGFPIVDAHIDDYIYVPHPDTGWPPIYISYNTRNRDYAYYPSPKTIPALPAFPDAKYAKSKTHLVGGGGKRQRWKDPDGTIYEWDSENGAVEKYTRRGKHLGEFHPITGAQLKVANSTRRVDP